MALPRFTKVPAPFTVNNSRSRSSGVVMLTTNRLGSAWDRSSSTCASNRASDLPNKEASSS